jgi:hypothetical protein
MKTKTTITEMLFALEGTKFYSTEFGWVKMQGFLLWVWNQKTHQYDRYEKQEYVPTNALRRLYADSLRQNEILPVKEDYWVPNY